MFCLQLTLLLFFAFPAPMVEANYQSAQRSIPMNAMQLTDLAASFK
jgi:hypothetical protein